MIRFKKCFAVWLLLNFYSARNCDIFLLVGTLPAGITSLKPNPSQFQLSVCNLQFTLYTNYYGLTIIFVSNFSPVNVATETSIHAQIIIVLKELKVMRTSKE